MEALEAETDTRGVSAKESGSSQGAKGLSSREIFWRAERPEKNVGGTEENRLESTEISWRVARLVSEGRGPESWFPGRKRDCRPVSEEREEGRVPEMPRPRRLMPVTRPPEHDTPVHFGEQGSEPGIQSDGAFLRLLLNSHMAEASSPPPTAEAMQAPARKRATTTTRGRIDFAFFIRIGENVG